MAVHDFISVCSTPTVPRSCCGLFLTWLLTTLFGCLPLFTSCFQVEPNEEVLVLFWGRLNAIYRQSGLYWYNAIGRSLIRVSTRTQAFEVTKTVVVDLNGNPSELGGGSGDWGAILRIDRLFAAAPAVSVSGIVTYRIVDSVKAGLDVWNVQSYLQSQAVREGRKP